MDYGIVSEPFVWLDEFPDLFVRDGTIVSNNSENSVSKVCMKWVFLFISISAFVCHSNFWQMNGVSARFYAI